MERIDKANEMDIEIGSEVNGIYRWRDLRRRSRRV